MTAPAPLRDQVASVLADDHGEYLDPKGDEMVWRCARMLCGWTRPYSHADSSATLRADHQMHTITALVDQREEEAREMVNIAGRLLTERDGIRDQHAALVSRVKALADDMSSERTCEPGDCACHGFMEASTRLTALLSDADTSALDQHDREVRAGALEEAANDLRWRGLTDEAEGYFESYEPSHVKWLNDRARAIRGGGPE